MRMRPRGPSHQVDAYVLCTKGDKDMQMVDIGASSGIIDCLFASQFGILGISHVTHDLMPAYYQADRWMQEKCFWEKSFGSLLV